LASKIGALFRLGRDRAQLLNYGFNLSPADDWTGI